MQQRFRGMYIDNVWEKSRLGSLKEQDQFQTRLIHRKSGHALTMKVKALGPLLSISSYVLGYGTDHQY